MTSFSAEPVPVLDVDALLALYGAKIFRFIFASVRDEDTAQTLSQDCFFRAYRACAQFRGESSVETWLFQIAINLVRDHGRNRRVRFWRRAEKQATPLGDATERIADLQQSIESSLLQRERLNAIWEASGKLAERQRTVFLLRFIEEMEVREIAAATGMKEGSVKSHLFRAINNIRQRVGQ